MKRLICLCLCITLALSVGALLCVGAAEDNMFKNGNFEKKLNGWMSWSNDPANCTVNYAKGKGVDGSYAMVMENKTPMANGAFQYADMKYGKTYIMQADVRYENVSPDGAGVVLGMTMYDAAANNIGEMVSSSHYGTSEGWIRLSFIFTVTNENAVTVNAGPRLWFSTGKVYVDNVTVREMTNMGAEAKPGTYDLTVSETPNRFPTVGLGCEWDPKLLLPVNKERGVTDEDLQLIKQRMREMGLQTVRMMVMPEWFEPTNDNDDPHSADFANFRWDSEEGKCTLAYLQVCQELGVDMLMYYDARPCGMNGMFSTDFVCERLKGYYPFYMFGQLYKLDSAVLTEMDDENLYAVAAKSDTEAAVMFTRYNDEDIPNDTVKVDLCGFGDNGTEVEVFILNEEHDLNTCFKATYYGEKFSVELSVPNYTSYLIKMKNL